MSDPDWEALRTLGIVADTGSMSRAAEKLGCAVSTITRRIDGLEQALGLTLLHRARGGVVPTEAGAAILASVKDASQFLNQVPRLAKHYHRFENRRPVRISATETVINEILMPHIVGLRSSCPDALFEFESSFELSSLEFGETDLAIRLARPVQSNLIMRKLPSIGMSVFINTTQLADRDPADVRLQDENIVWFDQGFGNIAENRLVEELGIHDRITLRSSSVRALAIACSHGQGLALLPNFLGKGIGLIPLAQYPIAPRDVWLVYHPETRNDPAMRKVRRWVVQSFRATLA
ncbi:LysR family transcriptional regulator [Erythrobacter mangrovi]|uniref:LysR family transcriptional regulator n=1 Tax=Erythrobacter mangrovi TaxID=2739433 RepID=A0A7D3XAD8_9SPHN|nr:LysR family transcriptional regulator [Erythrobacter mangrovi]QKG70520.1 LysR family transcriptional regulator [Erythrobacter mangrovi]